jgi:hypothetical protein
MTSRVALVAAPALIALVVAAAAGTARERPPASERYGAIAALASADADVRRRAADRLLAGAADRSLLPPLVDQLFFVAPRHRGDILRVLGGLTGERHERYLDWVQWLADHPQVKGPPAYLDWKGALFARIHPRFDDLLRAGTPLRIRAEEIVCGGVPFDGIPSLERPPHVAAAAARLGDDELVFAAAVGGDRRAWPLAVLSWHEMLNDRLGGEAVTLSFCTLCRSAVLYRGRLPSGEETTFGTSGLLYRSNKLMFDRRTRTLWSNLTGEPVLGPLAAGQSPPPLEPLPLVLTTWRDWRTRHPQTTVMVGDPALAKRYGYDYRPGAADARRAGVSFPVPRADARLPANEEVWGLRLGAAAKAYVVRALLAAGVLNDTVGGEPVVLVADPATGSLRAYRRGARRLRAGEGGELVDEQGARWRLDESALVPAAGGEPLARLPGVPSFWFGWQAFYPGSELWTGKS